MNISGEKRGPDFLEGIGDIVLRQLSDAADRANRLAQPFGQCFEHKVLKIDP